MKFKFKSLLVKKKKVSVSSWRRNLSLRESRYNLLGHKKKQALLHASMSAPNAATAAISPGVGCPRTAWKKTTNMTFCRSCRQSQLTGCIGGEQLRTFVHLFIYFRGEARAGFPPSLFFCPSACAKQTASSSAALDTKYKTRDP